MKPSLVIFGKTVASYRLFAILAVISGTTILLLLLGKKKIKVWKTAILAVFLLVFFFIGARLFNIFVNPAAYEDISVFEPEFVGLSIYGGFFGALLAVVLWCLLFRIPIFGILDLCIVPAAVSFAIARIGCFLNGCCSGKFTNSIFGVVYPKFADAGGLASYPVLPTQLFEMAFAIIILIPALIVQKKSDKFPEGSAFLVYANLFCIMRLFILPFRRLPYKSWVKHYFYPALYLILIFISLVIFLYRYIKNRKVNEKGY